MTKLLTSVRDAVTEMDGKYVEVTYIETVETVTHGRHIINGSMVRIPVMRVITTHERWAYETEAQRQALLAAAQKKLNVAAGGT